MILNIWLNIQTLDHIDVIITYGTTCLTKTVTKSIEFAVFETQSFTRNASVTRDRVTSLTKTTPYRTAKLSAIYEDAEIRTETRV